jgi:hypothetical protein
LKRASHKSAQRAGGRIDAELPGVVAEDHIVAVDARSVAASIDRVGREVREARHVARIDPVEQALVNGSAHHELVDDDDVHRWRGAFSRETSDDLRCRAGHDLDRRASVAFERPHHQAPGVLLVDAAVHHHAQAAAIGGDPLRDRQDPVSAAAARPAAAPSTARRV